MELNFCKYTVVSWKMYNINLHFLFR